MHHHTFIHPLGRYPHAFMRCFSRIFGLAEMPLDPERDAYAHAAICFIINATICRGEPLSILVDVDAQSSLLGTKFPFWRRKRE